MKSCKRLKSLESSSEISSDDTRHYSANERDTVDRIQNHENRCEVKLTETPHN